MRDEVLSTVGAQDTDKRGYELSDPEDIDISWIDPAVDMDSVYRLGTNAPFFPSIFDDFLMGSGAANPILVDDQKDKENSATTTTTPESEHPTEPPRLLRSCPIGISLENVLDSVYRTLFH